MIEEIINDVVYNLKKLTKLEKITIKEVNQKPYSHEMIINKTEFACIVVKQISKANYNLVVQQIADIRRATDKPLILMTQYTSAEIIDKLYDENINVAESSGNCKISANSLHIMISGQKSSPTKQTKGKAFNESGLKLIFYFLLNDENINKTYRQISVETGFSLGTIKNVIEELTNEQYVITTPKGRFLNNKMKLIDVWQTHYNQNLKPKLLLKELEFTNIENMKKWEDIPLPDGTCWGGEGGAYIADHYLTPKQFDIYTDEPTIKLVMTNKMYFKEDGSIKVYKKFWKNNTDNRIAPQIILYADLMGSGNSRCIEAAQRLIKHGI